MADVAHRTGVKIVDPTTDANEAAVDASSNLQTIDANLATSAALSDNFANPTSTQVGAMAMLWDGATWDRAPGNSVDGLKVDLGADNDVTVASGNIDVQGPTASDAPLTVDPVTVGGRASTAIPTAVSADGDVVNAWLDRQGAQKMVIVDDAGDSAMDGANNALNVNIVAGAAGGVSHIDDAAFTEAVDDGVPNFGLFHDVTPPLVTEGRAGIVRMSANRNAYETIRDAAGNERGVNVTAANELNVIATAQPGVDIGDVDVLSVVPGTAATNLGKARSSASAATDTGVAMLGVRDDVLSALPELATEYAPLLLDANGALWVNISAGGGGPEDTDDDVVAGGQQAVLSLGLNYGWDGTQWERVNTDAAGSLNVNVTLALPTGTNEIGDIGSINTNIVPGVAATSLGKAESAAHTTGDTGVAMWAVRDDTPVGLAADGQYIPLTTDAVGRLHVTDPNAGAGTPTNPTVENPALANVAAGAESTGTELRTADLGSTTQQLAGFDCSSSVPFKYRLIEEQNDVETVRAIGFGRAGEVIQWRSPNKGYFNITFGAGAGFDGWRVAMTNMDNSQTADFYATFYRED